MVFQMELFHFRQEWRVKLTREYITHYGVTQKRHAVDNIPQAFEMRQNVMHSVGRRLQRHFYPCEKLSCKNNTKVKVRWTHESYTLTGV